MDEFMDEHEQGERIRAWLRENGAAIVTGVAIGIALLFGWQWWKQSAAESQLIAATQYQALQDAAERSDQDAVDALAMSLSGEFGNTVYATWAQLTLADSQLSAGDLPAARASLERAIAEADHALVADLAKIRLARVLLAAGEADAALQQLSAIGSGGYEAAVAELRGDAMVTLGRIDEARDAYQLAVQELDPASPGRRLLEMKLLDAGGTPPALES